jgi:hypothetical protein
MSSPAASMTGGGGGLVGEAGEKKQFLLFYFL